MVEQVNPIGPVGAIVGYDADRVSGHCKIAMLRLGDDYVASTSSGLMIDGFFAFGQYLFDHFNFRKLYIEVPEYNMSLFSEGIDNFMAEEGRFKDHYNFGDRWWDCFVLAIYRTTWEAVADNFRGSWPDGHFDSHPGLRKRA